MLKYFVLIKLSVCNVSVLVCELDEIFLFDHVYDINETYFCS